MWQRHLKKKYYSCPKLTVVILDRNFFWTYSYYLHWTCSFIFKPINYLASEKRVLVSFTGLIITFTRSNFKYHVPRVKCSLISDNFFADFIAFPKNHTVT